MRMVPVKFGVLPLELFVFESSLKYINSCLSLAKFCYSQVLGSRCPMETKIFLTGVKYNLKIVNNKVIIILFCLKKRIFNIKFYFICDQFFY